MTTENLNLYIYIYIYDKKRLKNSNSLHPLLTIFYDIHDFSFLKSVFLLWKKGQTETKREGKRNWWGRQRGVTNREGEDGDKDAKRVMRGSRAIINQETEWMTQGRGRAKRMWKKKKGKSRGGRKAAGFAHSSIICPLHTFNFTSSHMSTQTAVQMNQKLEVVEEWDLYLYSLYPIAQRITSNKLLAFHATAKRPRDMVYFHIWPFDVAEGAAIFITS